MLASAITTLRDLSLPALVGTIVGAAIAHYTAKARGREEHARTLDLLVHQDERRAALAILDACRDMRNRTHFDAVDYAQMHNDWQDRVSAPSRLIRSDELNRRVRAFGSVIFFAFHATSEHVPYAVGRGALDVEEWLEAWLRREDAPPAHLPPADDLGRLVVRDSRFSFDELNRLLTEGA